MEKPVPLKEMSPEEQRTEINRRWQRVAQIVMQSHERRRREREEQAVSVSKAS